jgi:YD repeat-containing protein
VTRTDAKSQQATFGYDKLGRLTSRSEPEGDSQWQWGNSAAGKNIGRLWQASGPGYSEIYSYDSTGRTSSVSINADTAYTIDYGNNPFTGFVDKVTYPASTAGYRLRAQYLYQNGVLSQVRDYNAPATVWWRLNAQDARGNATDEQLGNGVHIISDYSPLTGHINWQHQGTNAGYSNLQYLT